jgi:hypothetical protein
MAIKFGPAVAMYSDDTEAAKAVLLARAGYHTAYVHKSSRKKSSVRGLKAIRVSTPAPAVQRPRERRAAPAGARRTARARARSPGGLGDDDPEPEPEPLELYQRLRAAFACVRGGDAL